MPTHDNYRAGCRLWMFENVCHQRAATEMRRSQTADHRRCQALTRELGRLKVCKQLTRRRTQIKCPLRCYAHGLVSFACNFQSPGIQGGSVHFCCPTYGKLHLMTIHIFSHSLTILHIMHSTRLIHTTGSCRYQKSTNL